ncbi:hypothetical protein EB796_014607 [Bugula neritina]|uniref:Protein sleepless n=1 Tax=Bugula neritina TaxID=10212 RepID=A0A7J7JN78_BUGNE|nr:hypothetical protein EB796_014607 [Bugula neritina]
MHITYISVFRLLAVSTLFFGAKATVCYECTGYDSDCGDAYEGNVQHEVSCDKKFNTLENGGCTKLKVTSRISGVKTTGVTRSCGSIYDNSECLNKDADIYREPNVRSRTLKCSCKGDRCNVMSKVSSPVSLIFMFQFYWLAR